MFLFNRVHSVILVAESGLFGLFVTAIMCDQLQAIFGDETAVEQAKHQGPYRLIYLLYITLNRFVIMNKLFII